MSNTQIPAQEVELETKRQRLYHVTWLNRARLDKQLRPLLRDLESSPGDGGRMGVLFKATFRGAVALVNHYLHFDIREHPSAIFLILLKLMDDRSFDGIWNDYSPMIMWVNHDYQDSDSPGEVSAISYTRDEELQLSPTTRLSNANSRHARVRKNNVQQNPAEASSGQEADSDTGLET